MKLTVGIPTFNRAEWLRESIDSVLAQSFTSFRLIVSDNASDDDTPEVVRSFDDDRIQYVRSARNIGALGNINRLIALADTEFLVLLPDDDVLRQGHLDATMQVLERFETVGLVHTAFEFVDAESRVIRSVNPLPSRSAVRVDGRTRALEYLMVSPWGLCFASVAYRTKALVDAGGFREEEGPFGDRQLWMRVALNWDFGYIPQPLVGLRTHAESVTSNIGAEDGVSPHGDDLVNRHSQVTFEARMDFLDDAPLESGCTRRLRALATLQVLVETGPGLPWSDVAVRLGILVRTYPRITLRPPFWRLVLAQLGGRRMRSALRRAWLRGGRARKARA